MRLALIAVFGAVGTLARYGLQGVVQVRAASTFPVGTLVVNLTGCFLLGLIGQFTLNRMVISPDWRVAIAVGFFGGYTTFSSFGWETAKLLRLSQDLPIILEVIESIERIERILPHLDEMVEGGLITLEKVRVILYRAAKK